MIVVWGDGKLTLSGDGADDDEPLSDDAINQLASLLATSRKLAFVLTELAALVEEHWAAGRSQAAANAAAVAVRTRQVMH